MSIRVLIVDDHLIVRTGLTMLLLVVKVSFVSSRAKPTAEPPRPGLASGK